MCPTDHGQSLRSYICFARPHRNFRMTHPYKGLFFRQFFSFYPHLIDSLADLL